MWREEGLWALLWHVRLVFLRRLHNAAWDRRFNMLEPVSTSTLLAREHLQPRNSKNLSSAREYTPSPRLVINWLLDGLKKDFSKFSFVDFGSGRGRVILAAAERPFRHVTGVEFCRQLHSEAKLNIAGYPNNRLRCKEIKSVCIDAGEFEIPKGDCILYFYNPFDASLMDKVITNALDTAQQRGSRLIVVYYNPVHRNVVARQTRLQPIALPILTRIKLNLFSPYPACLYKFSSIEESR